MFTLSPYIPFLCSNLHTSLTGTASLIIEAALFFCNSIPTALKNVSLVS